MPAYPHRRYGPAALAAALLAALHTPAAGQAGGENGLKGYGVVTAAQRVEIRPRVTGTVLKVHFKDGAEVKKGELLYELDARHLQTALDRAKAAVAAVQAGLEAAKADVERVRKLLANRAISREDYDRVIAREAEARPLVHKAEAEAALARLELEFTRIVSPIDGRAGRALVDPGNVVKADETPLTTVVSQGRVYVDFSTAEKALPGLLRAAAAAKPGKLAVRLSLPDDTEHDETGALEFIDNEVRDGAVRCRAAFENGKGLLVPGTRVGIRVPFKGKGD